MFNKPTDLTPLEKRIEELEARPMFDIQVLNKAIINPTDILFFKVWGEPESDTQLQADKAVIVKFLRENGIHNEVLVLNNCELEIARSLVQ